MPHFSPPPKKKWISPQILGFQPTPKNFEGFWGSTKNAPHLGVGKYIRIIPGLQITPPRTHVG